MTTACRYSLEWYRYDMIYMNITYFRYNMTHTRHPPLPNYIPRLDGIYSVADGRPKSYSVVHTLIRSELGSGLLFVV